MLEDTEALKALAKMIQVGNDGDWNDSWRAATIIKAREALPALERMLASQTQDMVLVPREPTPDMVEAGMAHERDCSGTPFLANVYKAMVAAAPVASQMGEPDVEKLAQQICDFFDDPGYITVQSVADIIRKHQGKQAGNE